MDLSTTHFSTSLLSKSTTTTESPLPSSSTLLSTVIPVLTTTFLTIGSLQDFQNQFLWAVIAGFVTSFLLGFGMGSNDVANVFGTSVGSKVLTLRQANFLATILETAGAVLVGYNVVDTVRKSIVEIGLYKDEPGVLLVGQIAILGGCSCWLMITTTFRLPVSSTHAIVGATLGFTLLMRGNAGIHWSTIGKIGVSWFISPVISGSVSSCIYMCVDFAVLRRENPFECGLRVMPVFYFCCFSFYTFMVLFDGSRVLHLHNLPFWMALLISIGIGLTASLVFLIILRPRVVKWAMEMNGSELKNGATPPNNEFHMMTHITRIPINGVHPVDCGGNVEKSEKEEKEGRAQPFEFSPSGICRWFFPRRDRKEDQRTLRLFSIIQVVTGCFAGFSHGASDVSHTIAPLVALLDIYETQSVLQKSDTPLWMMFYGVSGTCLGFWLLGHRVMKTIGKKITEINPCNGFAIEFGMAITVLCASKIGIPISSTHCLVGSVMFVGLIKAGEGVDWRVLSNVGLSWLVTLPVSALFSAAIMFLLNWAFLNG